MNPARYHTGDTICAPATPPGIGALAVIRLSGPDAIKIAAGVFKGVPLDQAVSHTVHLGKITDDRQILDEVLATVFIAPASYTGEHVIELSCHGSPFIQQKILELLVRRGARLAQPGEFTLRAFLNRKLDLSQAEAVADLIASDSDAALQTALQQMRGGYSQIISETRAQLLDFASLIELELDFSEEDVEFANRAQLTKLLQDILMVIDPLISSFRYGNAIRNGVPVVIAGKPNAGKSTLLNALLKEERAIVSEMEGTTRDTIEERFVVDGILFRLIDTAGIRKGTSFVEEKGIERTFEKMKQADIVLYLFDVNTTSQGQLQRQLEELGDIRDKVVLIGNKTDDQPLEILKEKFGSGQEIIFISSRSGQNMDALLLQMKKKIFSGDAGKGQVVISNLRHYEALLLSKESLLKANASIEKGLTGELLAFEIRSAIYHLGEITGEITTDDLLGNIFSRFCIGK